MAGPERPTAASGIEQRATAEARLRRHAGTIDSSKFIRADTYLGRPEPLDFPTLLKLLPDRGLKRATRSTVPLLAFWRDFQTTLTRICRLLGTNHRPSGRLCFESPVASKRVERVLSRAVGGAAPWPHDDTGAVPGLPAARGTDAGHSAPGPGGRPAGRARAGVADAAPDAP